MGHPVAGPTESGASCPTQRKTPGGAYPRIWAAQIQFAGAVLQGPHPHDDDERVNPLSQNDRQATGAGYKEIGVGYID